MADQEHLAILKQGVDAWNKWRAENPDTQPDLSEVNLSGATLIKADLGRADLRKANLTGADLSEANLSGANLRKANLRLAVLSQANLEEATLSRAIFINANLFDADLSEANLSGANLSGANLLDADLFKANLIGTDLISANLSEADFSLANLSNANLGGANLIWAHLRGADLSGTVLSKANLNGANLIKTNLAYANLTGCSIHGISAWNVKLEGATQAELVITPSYEPTIKVDDLEVAQFVYLLLNREKLRNVLNAVTKMGVLLLGRFGDGGLELLQAIAEKLRDLGYLPMLFDFERPDNRDYTETVKTLVGLARFVIVDLSGPSVPQELYATVPHFNIPFAFIIQKGRETYAMHVDLFKYPWVLPPFEFESQEQLLKLLPAKVIDPAEERHQEKQAMLDKWFKQD